MGIRVSPKHGVNPSLALCWYCGKETGDIILPGLLKGDAEAPHRAVWNREPCKECADWMEQGIMLISVKDGESGENPYRTGKVAVLREEAVRRMVQPPELAEQIIKARVAFMPDEAWRSLGLPE